MNATMRAAVMTKPGEPLTVEELRLPEPKAGEVRLKVTATGVCHTDLHVLKGEVAFPSPGVLGHEVSGVIDAIGPGVRNLTEGDRVVSSFIMPCGSCRHCVRGHEDLCELFFQHNRLQGHLYDGTTRLFRPDGEPIAMYSMGAMSEFCIVPDTDVFPVPDSIDLAEAAVLGCSVFTAIGAVRNVAQVQPGDTVAVVAVGGVGLNIVQIARAFGASRIIAIDVSQDKLALAEQMGATDLIDARDTDPVAALRDLTGGRGVDTVFEALGSTRTVEQAIRMADDGGKVVLVGIAPVGVTAQFEITHVVRRKIQVLGSYGARARSDMPLALELAAAGRIDISSMITQRYDLDGADEAFRRLAAGQIVGRAIVEPRR